MLHSQQMCRVSSFAETKLSAFVCHFSCYILSGDILICSKYRQLVVTASVLMQCCIVVVVHNLCSSVFMVQLMRSWLCCVS